MNAQEASAVGASCTNCARRPDHLMVEHNMGLVTEFCDSCTVINFGRLLAEGDPKTASPTRRCRRPISDARTMLTVSKLSASYGAIQAVRTIDSSVQAGQFAVLLGANGAGKSTTLRSIAGLHRPVADRSASARGRSRACRCTAWCGRGSPSCPRGAWWSRR